MSLASLLGGLALANAGLGAVHGLASVIGGMFPAPHGAVCARLLPHTMEINLRALEERSPESDALHRYDELAQILTGNDQASALDGVTWARELCEALHIPHLAAYGMTQDDWPTVIQKSAVASSMKGNPIQLTTDEMQQVIEHAA
jgi:alcohol dehydrogenase class IV